LTKKGCAAADMDCDWAAF